jgi:hypothetical protein
MLYPLIRDYSTGERIGEKIIWEFSHPYPGFYPQFP